jgi:hypothetical protein
VAFKHNLPIPALILVLLAGGVAAVVFFHQPPDEDLLRQAVDRHVATLGPVRDLQIHGNVADIVAGDKGTLIYAEFEKRNGEWTYARNLAEEFSKAMKDPEIQKTVLQHLAEKVGNRLQMTVTISPDLSQFAYKLQRDLELKALIGTCTVNFAYPKVKDTQRRGQYVENFEWKDGRWQSWGPGALYDKVGP